MADVYSSNLLTNGVPSTGLTGWANSNASVVTDGGADAFQLGANGFISQDVDMSYAETPRDIKIALYFKAEGVDASKTKLYTNLLLDLTFAGGIKDTIIVPIKYLHSNGSWILIEDLFKVPDHEGASLLTVTYKIVTGPTTATYKFKQLSLTKYLGESTEDAEDPMASVTIEFGIEDFVDGAAFTFSRPYYRVPTMFTNAQKDNPAAADPTAPFVLIPLATSELDANNIITFTGATVKVIGAGTLIGHKITLTAYCKEPVQG